MTAFEDEKSSEVVSFIHLCKNIMRLKDLCEDERPRERLLSRGADTLSNVELLAILLRTGTGRMNVLDVARELLRSGEGRLSGVASMSVEKLCEVDGVGPGKAVAVAAAFEIGRRLAEEEGVSAFETLDSPKKVFRVMMPVMKHLDHEQCWALFLNRANRLLGREMMTRGGQESTVIDRRAIIRRALERKASAVILVHNHPSGNALPSIEDIRQTKELSQALKTCELQLIDHVIVSDSGYYSFADEQLVSKKF